MAFGAFASVAVAISVAVTEVRADAGDGGVVGAVEYYGHVVVALVVVELLYVGEHVAFEQAPAYYEECEVYVAVDDFCIGDNFYRWAVEQYVVESSAGRTVRRDSAGWRLRLLHRSGILLCGLQACSLRLALM